MGKQKSKEGYTGFILIYITERNKVLKKIYPNDKQLQEYLATKQSNITEF